MPHSNVSIRGIIAKTMLILILMNKFSFAQEHVNRDYEVAITKGVFQVETNDYPAAIDSFKKVLSIKPHDKILCVLKYSDGKR